MALRIKVLLALLVAALLPLLILGSAVYLAVTTSLRSIEFGQLNDSAKVASLVLDDIQVTQARFLLEYSNWDEMHTLGQNEPSTSEDIEWFKSMLGPDGNVSAWVIHNLSALGVWNREKKVIYELGDLQAISTILKSQLDAVMDSQVEISTLVNVSDKTYLVSIQTIRNTDGDDPYGAILFARLISQLDSDRIKTLTGLDVALYNSQQLLSSSSSLNIAPSTKELQDVVQTAQTLFITPSNDVMLALVPYKNVFDQIALTIAVGLPNQTVGIAQETIARTLLIGAISSFFLVLLISSLLSRAITNPLSDLSKTVKQITSGNLRQRAPVRTNDEIGTLGIAFNQMAEQLSARVQSSETENKRLHQVDEFRLNLIKAVTGALKDPMLSISNNSQMLDMEIHGSLNEVQKQSVTSIRRSVSRLGALLSDMMDFAYAQTNQLKIARSRIAIRELIREVTASTAENLREKSIHLEVNMRDNLPTIYADRTRMEQVLEYLLLWEADISAVQSSINLDVSVSGNNQVRFTISDTSGGISIVEYDRLFEPFYHPRSMDGNDVRPGSQMGLSFIKAMIEQQGGLLEVQVEPGRGNMFHVLMPTT